MLEKISIGELSFYSSKSLSLSSSIECFVSM